MDSIFLKASFKANSDLIENSFCELNQVLERHLASPLPSELSEQITQIRQKLCDALCYVQTTDPALKLQESLHHISETTASKVGDDFFRTAVSSIATVLEVPYVFIGELDRHDASLMHSVAFWSKGQFIDNLSYTLPGTPCEQVAGKKVCVFSQGLRSLFPQDEYLVHIGAESYFGVPLFDSFGSPLGILSIMDEKPLPDYFTHTETLLKTVAFRAAAEIERRQVLEALRRNERKYYDLFEDNPQPMWIYNIHTLDFAEVNKAATTHYGYSREEFLSMKIPGIYSSGQMQGTESHVLLPGREDAPLENEPWQHRKKNGEIIYVEITTKYVSENPHHRLALVSDITGRTKAEQKLAESEQRYRNLFEINPQIMWVFDLDTFGFVDVNQAAVVHYGYSREEFLSMTIKDIRPPDDIAVLTEVIDYHQKYSSGGLDKLGQWKHIRKDGTLIDVEIYMQYLPDRNGQRTRLVLVKDVTESNKIKNAEHQLVASLHESEKRFRDLAESCPIVIWIDNEQGECTYVNNVWSEVSGLPVESGIGRDWLELIHPDDKARSIEAYVQAIAQRRGFTAEHRLLHSSGKYKWLLNKGVPRFHQEVFTGFVGCSIDITERVEAEERLRQSEAQLREAQTMARLGTWEYDVATQQLSWSDETYRIYGYEPGSRIPSKEEILTHRTPEEIVSIQQQWNAAIEQGVPFSYDSRIFLTDGTSRYVQAVARPLTGEDGKIQKVYGTLQDITERKQYEEQIWQSRQLYQSITLNLPRTLVVLLSPEMHITFVEGKMLEEWQINEEFFLGKHIDELLRPHESALHQSYYSRALGGENVSFEYEAHDRIYTISALPLRDHQHRITQIMVVLQDITEQKQVNRQLRQSEANLREAQQIARLGNWSYDIATKKVTWSDETYRIYGFDQQQYSEAPQKELWTRIPRRERKNGTRQLKEAIERGISCSYDSVVNLPDGSVKHVQIIATPVFKDETLSGLKGTVMDITTRKKTELRLQRRLEIENMISSVSSLFVNVAAEELDNTLYLALSRIGLLAGAEKATLLMINEGMTMMGISHQWKKKEKMQPVDELPVFSLHTFQWWKHMMQQGSTIHILTPDELPAAAEKEKHKLKELGIKSLIGVPIVYNNKPVGSLVVSTLTREGQWQGEEVFMLRMMAEMIGNALQRRDTEREVIRQKEYLRQIIDSDPNVIFVKNYSGHYLLTNKAFADMMEMPLGQILNRRIEDLIPSREECQRYHRTDRQVLERLESFTQEETFTHPQSGRFYQFLMTKKPLIMPDGSLGILGVASDITALKKSAEELRHNERLFQAVFNNSTDALFLVDTETNHINDCNDTAVRMFGFEDKQQLIGRHGNEWQKRPFTEEELRQILTDVELYGTWSIEVEYVNARGEDFWGSLAATRLDRSASALNLVRVSNITERKLAEIRLKSSYKALSDFRAALDVSSIVAISDPAGRIREVNDNFCALSGYLREELIGAPHRIVNSGYHPKAFFTHLWKTIQQGKVWKGEIRNRAKNGTEYWQFTTIIPFMDENNEPIQYLEICNDITSRKQAEEELLIAKEKAEESNLLKSRFLANMSHEIRTPLNGILGLAQVISMESREEETTEYARLIEDSGYRLLRTINHILDLSKLEAKKTELQLTRCPVGELVEKLVKTLKVLADQKSLSLQVTQNVQRIYAKADEALLGQVINNLVGNAIKFTESGGIHIVIDRVMDEQVPMVSLQVIDTGSGIPASYFPNLFTPFSQASTAVYGRKHQGTGLGLSISKNFIELMHGKILVRSEEGKGSTFEILLPEEGNE